MESEKVLIIKKKRSQNRFTAKVRKRVRKEFAPDQYMKVLNPHDANDLALLLEDLDLIVGAPIEKAIQKYRENKIGGYTFF